MAAYAYDLLDSSSSDLSSLGSMSDVPSSPLSMLSRSPSPPCYNYMTPPSSQTSSQQSSQSGSPTPDGMEEEDGQRPSKRRRISSKERTTEYLDLSKGGDPLEQRPQMARLLKALHKRRKIVVVAGAGISVSAGIQDFRSKTGLFSSLKTEHKLKGSGKDLFDASVYRDHDSTTSFHDMVKKLSRQTKTALPTDFHHMLASLAHDNRLLRLYSQNVDGIDTGLDPLKTTVPLRKQDGKWPKTIQLHGGLDKMVCSKCHKLSDLDADLFEGPVAPACKDCQQHDTVRTTFGKRSHGIGGMRPRMVLYSEPNPDADAIGAVTEEDLRRRPDAIIVVGTTLKVPGVIRIVKDMCRTVKDHRDGVAIWINSDPPPAGQFKDCFDIIVNGKADEVAQLVDLPRWNATTSEDIVEVARKITHIPGTLKPLSPPSKLHANNSFKPPSPGSSPKYDPLDLQSSPEPEPFTPRASRTISVLQSIECKDKYNMPVVDPATGLLTPTTMGISKSADATPIIERLLQKDDATKIHIRGKRGRSGNAAAKKTAPRRKGGVKSRSKPQANTLVGNFKHSKAVTASAPMKQTENDEISGDNVAATPKKLHTAAENNRRMSLKGSPIKRAVFPGFMKQAVALENIVPTEGA